MAKNKISDWDVTAAGNTDVGGIDIRGTANVRNHDDGMRTVMSQVAKVAAGTDAMPDTFSLGDPADLTKRFRIDVGNVSTATTRVMTLPNQDVTITSAGAAILDDADAAAQRATLGLGTMAVQNLTAVAATTFSDLVNLSNASPELRLTETDTTTQARMALAAGANYILTGSTGGGASGSGTLRIAGYATTTDIGAFEVRHSGAWRTIWHAGNDGAGSGLDADLLDGQQGAYYLSASTYTAADILAKLITVDGTGSALDADTVDGIQGASLVQTSRTITAGTGLTGGGDLSADRTISAAFASLAQAQAGTSVVAVMNPQRTVDAIAYHGLGGGLQTWQDVSGSRTSGTSYQNTTGRPIAVAIELSSGSGEFQVSVNGTTWLRLGAVISSGSDIRSGTWIVPNGNYYRVTSGTFVTWAELR